MRRDLAARIGVWSTHHRRTAVLGWLLFVVLATGIGGATGMVEMTDAENGAGESARAEQILLDAGLDKPAGELVMVSAPAAGDWKPAADALADALRETGEAQNIAPPVASEDGKDALIAFEMKGEAATSSDRVQPVLDAVAAVGEDHPGAEIHQFGEASAGKWLGDLLAEDFRKAEFTAVPLALGILLVAFITAVTFLLMLFCFRSYVIAVTSIVLNLLSVAASYGVMTAVFQHGWGASLIGSEGVGAIEAWMPLFVLVVLFGLSMDYHVFVVSRIREARGDGLDNRAAIETGIRRTAGAVTGAAAIMVAVFAVFGTLSMQDMQQMGVGLAVAVLLDATVVRMVLLPSVMLLLGERNWRTPRGLSRLPGLEEENHGGYDEPAAPVSTSAPVSPPAPAGRRL
ncbi:MMPL family transporter [Streptomyces sp. NPDC094466]|uniref:MMPL family transporter n=1 Tax=Streptomyces sp. NPDC094466 TaxID=3366065 RepID=UPI00381EE57F